MYLTVQPDPASWDASDLIQMFQCCESVLNLNEMFLLLVYVSILGLCWTGAEVAKQAAALCQGGSWDLNCRHDCSLQWPLWQSQDTAGLVHGLSISERKGDFSSPEGKDAWTSSKVSWGNSHRTETSLWRWDGGFLAMCSDESLQLLLI